MALQPPEGHPNAKPVVFFPNQGKGYGYGVTQRGETGTLPEGYDRTINMTVSEGGRVLSPSLAHTSYYSLASPVPPSAIVPWIDASGYPFTVILQGNDVTLLQTNGVPSSSETDATPRLAVTAVANNGTGHPRFATSSTSSIITNDAVNIDSSTVAAYNGLNQIATVIDGTHFDIAALTYSSTATCNWQREARYSNAALWDDGSGVPYLYAGVKTGTRRNLMRRNRAGTWTETANGDATSKLAYFVVVSGGKLWSAYSDYQIQNWSTATDPFTATAGNRIYVGSPSDKITSMNHIGNSPVVGKEDGVWAYNAAEATFDKIFPMQRDVNNCPFLKPDGAGGLYTADTGGNIIHIERFGTISTIRPLQDKPGGRDTPRGKIKSVCVRGNKIWAVMDGGYKKMQPSGLCVLVTTDNGVTYTDYTSNMTDQRVDGAINISALDTLSNGDWIAVGHDDRALLWDLTMNTVATSPTRVAAFPLISSGGTMVTSGLQPLYNSTQLFNGTDTTPATISTAFGQSGAIVLKHNMQSGGSWTFGTPGTGTWTNTGSPAGFAQYANKYWIGIGVY